MKISDSSISGALKQSDGTTKNFTTALSTNVTIDQAYTDWLQTQTSTTSSCSRASSAQLLINILPFVLIMGLLYWFVFRRMNAAGAGALNMGKNKVKIYDRKEMKTTFADVAGVDEAKDELREIVEFLSNPKKYQRLGGRIPKGVLLLGPPGCGKTLLARAVAGEANVPFFFMSGSEFVEMFVGLGAARVRELFQQAKEKAPALVFLDEIDTIGKGRAGVSGAGFGAHDEREQTLNQLLVEMDGFDASKGVIIMAATNRPDVLDPALVRPGRFDRQVVVDRPDLKGREEILRVHARGVALSPDVDLHTIAARTPGFTGADLENVVNEAALLAARREKNSVGENELEEAIDRASMGLERKSRVMSEKEKTRVAFHEMGHALVAHYCENLDPIHRITIIPRGTAALGLTMTRPLEDRYLATEPELKDMLAFAMGGRVAEEIIFDEISTGAQNDLEKATQIARAMVAEYGMSEKVGPLSLGHDDPNSIFGGGPRISSGTVGEDRRGDLAPPGRGPRPGPCGSCTSIATCSTASRGCCWSPRRSTGQTSRPTRPARRSSPTRSTSAARRTNERRTRPPPRRSRPRRSTCASRASRCRRRLRCPRTDAGAAPAGRLRVPEDRGPSRARAHPEGADPAPGPIDRASDRGTGSSSAWTISLAWPGRSRTTSGARA